MNEAGVPPGDVVICHSNADGSWNQLQLPAAALNGHEQHSTDIWPPYDGVTEGRNWPQGEEFYNNGCMLPDTGAGDVLLVLAVMGAAFLAIGIYLWQKARDTYDTDYHDPYDE